MVKRLFQHSPIERFIRWVGSSSSLVLHTLTFILFFVLAISGAMPWSRMLLVLTTVVSLEAIYLAIFIQLTVNRQSESIREVEEDIDEIQEDVEEMSEDLNEIQEDVEELGEDEVETEKVTLELLARDLRHVLSELESLKKKL